LVKLGGRVVAGPPRLDPRRPRAWPQIEEVALTWSFADADEYWELRSFDDADGIQSGTCRSSCRGEGPAI
jgi:hypothetical protein